jgi:hypothetical protein
LFSDFADLLVKIDEHHGKLSDLGTCENACATSDAYKLKEFIEEEPTRATKKEYLRIVNTGTIGKFASRWGQREMVYLGSRYSRPVVEKSAFLKAFPNSYGKKAIKKKLIIKGLNLLDACLDDDGTIIPGKTTLIITSNDLDSLKVILGIINCHVPFFYIRERYPASSYNQGTTFTKEMLNNLPIPKLTSTDRSSIISLVDRILSTRARNFTTDITTLERELSKHVSKLYGLTPNEISIVEASRRGK